MRDVRLDYLKGIGMLFVIIGHSIQFGNGEAYDYWEDKVFQFIYSFHMPLFMLISGYLFWFSACKHSVGTIINNRCLRLLYPIFTFMVVCVAAGYIKPDPFQCLWFLWAIIYSTILTIAVRECLNDKPIAYIAVILSFLFLPEYWPIGCAKWVFGYFVAGYHIARYNITIRFKQIAVCSALFMLLLPFYSKDVFIYISGINVFRGEFSVIEHLVINTYRFLVGLCGAVAIGALCLQLVSKTGKATQDILTTIGKKSLSLYIIQSYIFMAIPYHYPELEYNVPRTIGLFIAITIGGLLLTMIIGKLRITNKYILGQ